MWKGVGKCVPGNPEMADKLASHRSRFPHLSFSYQFFRSPFGSTFVTFHWAYRIASNIPGKLNIIALKLKSALSKLNISVSLRYHNLFLIPYAQTENPQTKVSL